MHRVRVGLTGLACVFVLVMLATALLRMAGTRDAQQPATKAAAPAEPLAQLGVAPGNPGPAADPRSATPPPPPRSRTP